MKKCRNCKEPFTPRFSTLEKYCWLPECKTIEAMEKLEKVKKKESQEWKKEKKVRKEKLKTRSEWLNDLQVVFNAFIRERDRELPCVSCGTVKAVQYDCGHYRSVGAHPELRFTELNCAKQCRKCNSYWGGNVIEYRKELINRIGLDKVKDLERNDHEPLKLTVDEIKKKIKFYRKKTKELK